MHNHCINKLLNLKGVTVKKISKRSPMQILLWTSCWNQNPKSIFALPAANLQKEYTATGCKPSRIFLFSWNTVAWFCGNGATYVPVENDSMKTIHSFHVTYSILHSLQPLSLLPCMKTDRSFPLYRFSEGMVLPDLSKSQIFRTAQGVLGMDSGCRTISNLKDWGICSHLPQLEQGDSEYIQVFPPLQWANRRI